MINNKDQMKVHLQYPQINAYVGISIDRPLVCNNHSILARPKSEPRKSWARLRMRPMRPVLAIEEHGLSWLLHTFLQVLVARCSIIIPLSTSTTSPLPIS